MVKALFAKTNRTIENIDLFVFHQANSFMLDKLRRQSKIPDEKFLISMENIGNTVTSTIPIALTNAKKDGVLKNKKTLMLVGFGVGLSWAACLINNTWDD